MNSLTKETVDKLLTAMDAYKVIAQELIDN